MDVNVRVEAREGHSAALVEQFPITVYGDSQALAEERAVEAVMILQSGHSDTAENLGNYLTDCGMSHLNRTDFIFKSAV